MDMIWMLAALLAAFLVGLIGKPPKRLVTYIEYALTAVIYFLIFLMGYNLGRDDMIFSRLPQLGAMSLAIAAAAVIGSLAGVFLVHPIVGRYKPHNEASER